MNDTEENVYSIAEYQLENYLDLKVYHGLSIFLEQVLYTNSFNWSDFGKPR